MDVVLAEVVELDITGEHGLKGVGVGCRTALQRGVPARYCTQFSESHHRRVIERATDILGVLVRVLSLPLVAVVPTVGPVVPQWDDVVLRMIVRVDEAGIDCAAGRNRHDSLSGCGGDIRSTPDRLDYPVDNQYPAVVDDRFLRFHGDDSTLEDVLAAVDVVLRGVAVALQVVGTTPLLIIGAPRSGATVRKFGPITARVVAVWDVPVRVFGTVTDRVHLHTRTIEDPDGVSIPEVELNSSPRAVEGDVGTCLEDRAPADAASGRTVIGDVIEPPATEIYRIRGRVVQFQELVVVSTHRTVAVPVGAIVILVVRRDQYLVDVDGVGWRSLRRCDHCGPQTHHQHEQDCGDG